MPAISKKNETRRNAKNLHVFNHPHELEFQCRAPKVVLPFFFTEWEIPDIRIRGGSWGWFLSKLLQQTKGHPPAVFYEMETISQF